MTMIDITIETPESEEPVLNGLVEQLRTLVAAKNPKNKFRADFIRPVTDTSPAISEDVAESADVTLEPSSDAPADSPESIAADIPS